MAKSPYRVVHPHPLVLELADDAPEDVAGCLMLLSEDRKQGSCTSIFTQGVDFREDPDLVLRNRILVCVVGVDDPSSACVSRNGTIGDMLPEDDELICALWREAGLSDIGEVAKRSDAYRCTRPDEGATPKP